MSSSEDLSQTEFLKPLPDFSGRKVDRYVLTSILHSGETSDIYSAVDASRRSHRFAVKCLPKHRIPDLQQIEVLHEINCHTAVADKPHILPIQDTLEDHEFYFLVFPMCETDMSAALWHDDVYWANDELIRQAFLELIDGVEACHQNSIFHRDLKPDNLMCRADGTGICISDFASASRHIGCRDGRHGSPSYMSPECWKSPVGHSEYSGGMADVWAMGIILFNMVTSRYPWKVALRSDKEYKAYLKHRDVLFDTQPISESFNELLKKLLHPDPLHRLEGPIAIRRAILEIDTFYKWGSLDTDTPQSSHADTAHTWSLNVAVAKKEKKLAASFKKLKSKLHHDEIDWVVDSLW